MHVSVIINIPPDSTGIRNYDQVDRVEQKDEILTIVMGTQMVVFAPGVWCMIDIYDDPD